MKKFISSLLTSLFIVLTVAPSPAWAQTKITIENNQSAEQLLDQLVTDFLVDNELVKNCLRNRRRQERRPLTKNVAVCSILNVFGTSSLSLTAAWDEAKKLQIISTADSQRDQMSDLEYFDMLFKVAGVTVSPISEKNISAELRKLRLRLPRRELKNFIIAIENGMIALPQTSAEAQLLEEDVKNTSTIGEAFGYLYQIGSSQHDVPLISITPQPISAPNLELENILKEVVRIIETESYFSSSFDQKKAMQAAIKAIAESLEEDKYIEYYTEEEYKSFSDGLNGNLEGIGAYIEERDEHIIIVSPIDGSPAAKADLRPEDIITHIDGETTEGLTLQQAVGKIRGPNGSTVKLTILRDGSTLVVPIVRAQIDIPALTTSNKNGIEIIKLVQFSNTSALEIRTELERIMKEQPRGVIIDLRNNPGGFLDQVVAMVDYFIDANQGIVYLKNRTSQTEISSNNEALFKNIPVSILINKGSASASEILAGALQSYGIAKVYGETSFGKGTVQNIITLRDNFSNESSAFKLTTSEYLVGAPNGQTVSIDGVGVIPDSNPNGTDLVDNRETPQDEALDAVLNLMR